MDCLQGPGGTESTVHYFPILDTYFLNLYGILLLWDMYFIMGYAFSYHGMCILLSWEMYFIIMGYAFYYYRIWILLLWGLHFHMGHALYYYGVCIILL